MNFEHKAANTFGYKLSATGFTTLVADSLRSGLSAVWADATYNIDVSDYDIANGTTIVLADYAFSRRRLRPHLQPHRQHHPGHHRPRRQPLL